MDDDLGMFLWLAASVVVFVLLAFAANFAVKVLRPSAALRRFLAVAFSGVAGACGAGLVAAVDIALKVPMQGGRRFYGLDWTVWLIIAAALVGFAAGATLVWLRTRNPRL